MRKSPSTKKQRQFQEHEDLLDECRTPASRFADMENRVDNLEVRMAQIENVTLRKNPEGYTTIGAKGA